MTSLFSVVYIHIAIDCLYSQLILINEWFSYVPTACSCSSESECGLFSSFFDWKEQRKTKKTTHTECQISITTTTTTTTTSRSPLESLLAEVQVCVYIFFLSILQSLSLSLPPEMGHVCVSCPKEFPVFGTGTSCVSNARHF